MDALYVFRHDIATLPEGETMEIKLGPPGSIKMNNENLLIMIRMRFDKQYSLSLITRGAFRYAQFFSVVIGPDYVELGIDMDRKLRGYPAFNNLVGGALIEMLREITVGGASISRIPKDGIITSPLQNTTTDKMVQELCGKNKIDLYMRLLGSDVQLKGAVPHEDYRTVYPLLCLYKEHR